ncbi:MAG: hypothetical protein IPP18_01295 [Rhodocyclaceae bacterium]|nr:hypothetical protein [Rhodocyclaceae bacterium]MBK9953803.1 hypothetical protein [Rhodocyclaceae bacterium]
MISTLSILPPTRAVASWIAVCALAGLAGCAGQPATLGPARAGPPIHAGEPRLTASHGETPVASNFKTATQPKLQAGQHWIAIADDTGRAIVEMLRRRAPCGPGVDKCSLVQVRPPTPMTEFGRAFHGQIVTTLVQQKVQVARAADAELTVDIDVQPVMFTANRPQYRHAGVPVELGPGIWALRDVATPVPVGASATPPAQDALHWFRAEFAAGQTPQAEILVTVSVADAKRYLARATSAYYIADTDKRLYDKEICALFELCPKGVAPGGAPGDGKAAVLRVTGDCPLDRPCPDPVSVAPVAATPAPVPAGKK